MAIWLSAKAKISAMTKPSPAAQYLECGKAFRGKLARRERLLGTFVKSTDPAVVEIVAQAGVDFIILDTEHRAIPQANLTTALLTARLYGLPVLVRVADSRASTISLALDEGALGIVVPAVSSAAQAHCVTAAARYRGGTRGFSPSVAANGYGALPADTYQSMADAAITVICQIETLGGLESAKDIMETPGVDAAFIGPVDLAHALKEQQDERSQSLERAIEDISATASAVAKPLGIFAPSTDFLSTPQAKGMSYFAIGTDFSLLKQSVTSVVRHFGEADKSDKQQDERRD